MLHHALYWIMMIAELVISIFYQTDMKYTEKPQTEDEIKNFKE